MQGIYDFYNNNPQNDPNMFELVEVLSQVSRIDEKDKELIEQLTDLELKRLFQNKIITNEEDSLVQFIKEVRDAVLSGRKISEKTESFIKSLAGVTFYIKQTKSREPNYLYDNEKEYLELLKMRDEVKASGEYTDTMKRNLDYIGANFKKENKRMQGIYDFYNNNPQNDPNMYELVEVLSQVSRIDEKDKELIEQLTDLELKRLFQNKIITNEEDSLVQFIKEVRDAVLSGRKISEKTESFIKSLAGVTFYIKQTKSREPNYLYDNEKEYLELLKMRDEVKASGEYTDTMKRNLDYIGANFKKENKRMQGIYDFYNNNPQNDPNMYELVEVLSQVSRIDEKDKELIEQLTDLELKRLFQNKIITNEEDSLVQFIKEVRYAVLSGRKISEKTESFIKSLAGVTFYIKQTKSREPNYLYDNEKEYLELLKMRDEVKASGEYTDTMKRNLDYIRANLNKEKLADMISEIIPYIYPERMDNLVTYCQNNFLPLDIAIKTIKLLGMGTDFDMVLDQIDNANLSWIDVNSVLNFAANFGKNGPEFWLYTMKKINTQVSEDDLAYIEQIRAENESLELQELKRK